MTKLIPLGMELSRRKFMSGAAALGSAAGLSGLGLGRALAAEPEKPAELIVRAWGGVWVNSLKAGVSDPFSKMTGISIRHDLTEDNEIQPKIWAAVAQHRPPPVHVDWDTTINATKSALHGVAEDLSDIPNLKNVLPVAKPVGLDGWPIVNTYSYVYVLAYNEDAFPDGAPTSWKVMADPKFKGRIALYNDGIGFIAPAEITGGGKLSDIPDNMQACWDFIAQLKPQQPLLGEDPDFTAWFQKGEVDLACTISANAAEAVKSGVKVKWTVPDEGATLDTDGMWIPKGFPDNELYWAKQYINYAISPEGQTAWLTPLGVPGVVPGLTVPPGLENDPSYPVTPEQFAKMLQVSPKVQVEHQSEWFAKFKEIMQS